MNKKMTFESALERLNEIVEQLESGEKPLDESLKLFEEGSALASFCYKKLSVAEQKIKTVTEQEEKKDGQN
ncbi:MAG TPA: exodeoxyribonuclease VII small subunit [Ruminococcaceae bacterium]|jgi:exodeoxyribonuclease VII small subunit|nr:exodeoxyribonuclease VII small subunit [Oscillospiraceae bacterium]